MGKTRVYVVDDEPAVRKGLKLLINRQPDLEVCGDADRSPAALKQILSLRPDLVILDLTLKENNGLQMTRQLRQKHSALKILIFSMHDEVSFVQAAFQAGAHGYVTKDEGSERLIEAIHRLLKGKPYLSATLAAKLPVDCAGWTTGNPPVKPRSGPRP